jgi:hypothetical protein
MGHKDPIQGVHLADQSALELVYFRLGNNDPQKHHTMRRKAIRSI